jgi:hypothetical protein
MANGRYTPLWYLLGAAAVLLTGAVLIAVVRSWPVLITGWALVALQIVVLIPLAVLALVLALVLVGWVAEATPRKMRAIAKDYAPEVKALRKRSPALLMSVFLISEGIEMLAHQGFGEAKEQSAAVTGIVLLVGFGIANELLASSSRSRTVLGWILWTLLVLFLPVAIIINQEITVPQFFEKLKGMDLGSKAFWIVALLAVLILPAATLDGSESKDDTAGKGTRARA